MGERLLRIGQVAEQAGVSPRTVDYYTGLGLLVPAARTEGNFRLYSPDVVERITAIRSLEDHGLSLEDITVALAIPAVDLPAALERLDQTLTALQLAAGAVAPDTQRLLVAVTARAHGLLLAALELAGALSSSPI